MSCVRGEGAASAPTWHRLLRWEAYLLGGRPPEVLVHSTGEPEEICRLLLPTQPAAVTTDDGRDDGRDDDDGNTKEAILLLRLTLLRRCCEDDVASQEDSVVARSKALIRAQLWADGCSMQWLLRMLAHENKWAALAARRALQALLFRVHPEYVGVSSRDDFCRSLRGHLERILQLVDVGSFTSPQLNPLPLLAVLKLFMDLLKSWRRSCEEIQSYLGDNQTILLESLDRPLLSGHQALKDAEVEAACKLWIEIIKIIRCRKQNSRAQQEEMLVFLDSRLVLRALENMTLTGQVLRAWSYLAKLLNILHEENICNNMLELKCIEALDSLLFIENKTCLNLHTVASQAISKGETTTSSIHISPLSSQENNLPLLPTVQSTLLSVEVTGDQLAILRRRIIILATRVLSCFVHTLAIEPESHSAPQGMANMPEKKRKASSDSLDDLPNHQHHRSRTDELSDKQAMEASSSACPDLILAAHIQAFLERNLFGSSNEFKNLIHDMEAFFILISSQDDIMIEVLNNILTIHRLVTAKEKDRPRSWIKTVLGDELFCALSGNFSPHILFAHFMQQVAFDSTTLLDLLIGNETNFLAFLTGYLHLLVEDANAARRIFDSLDQKNVRPEVSDDEVSEHGTSTDIANSFAQLHRTISRLDRKHLYPYRSRPLLRLLEKAVDALRPSDSVASSV